MNNVLCVCSGGGHLTEMIYSLPKQYLDNITIVTSSGGHAEKSLKDFSAEFVKDPHRSPIEFLRLFKQANRILKKYSPKVIISTGAGLAVPFILLSRITLSSQHIIFIETGARINTPSLTALLVYHLVDDFYVQSEDLLRFFKKAKYRTLW